MSDATLDERTIRRQRRERLIGEGINPYPINSTITAHAHDLDEKYQNLASGEATQDVYSVAGRIRALRNQGKLAFLELEDVSGKIQLFCRINDMDEKSWDLLASLDLGDIINATGTIMRTKRGQLSVAVSEMRLLSKSLRPLPEKFHGLTDKEMRYRQRYVDLIMNPEVRDVFRLRSRIISTIRKTMENLGYLEVETPILHDILGGANAKPFITHYNALGTENYLRIATELPLKRLIVGGMERVFEIGRQFRNEGMDLTHNPEFTTMEAYCAYSNLAGMKELTQTLFQTIAREVFGCEPGAEKISYQGVELNLAGTWRSATLAEIASEVTGHELSIDTPVDELRAVLDEHHLEWKPEWGAGKLLFEIYDELGEASIVDPTFVCDYPQEVSPLAKRKEDDPRLTDRFELVICGHEYANAFSELNDPVDQESRFAAQMEAKRTGDEEAMEYDEDYIRALEYGMPPAGGIGYGIDRMIMLFCDQASIRDVLLFPQLRPEKGRKKVDVGTRPEKEATGEQAPAEADGNSEDMSELIVTKELHDGDKLEAGISREQAYELMRAHNKDAFHVNHAETLEGLMGYFAKEIDPENVEFWSLVGLLHDLDWEEDGNPETHTLVGAKWLRELGATDELNRAIQSHNAEHLAGVEMPTHTMEKVLYAVDELSGLIQAAILMRPSKSVMDFEVKSLKKKFKDKKFAAGCDRDIIRSGAEMLGWELSDLFAKTIDALKAIHPVGSVDAIVK